jgi:hypothetical protein
MWSHGETVVWIKRDVGAGQDGNDTYVEVARETIVNVPVAPADANGTGSNENTDAREQVTFGATAFFPADKTPTAMDQVVVRGELWDVQGQPLEWRSIWSSWVPGTPVQLKRVEG